MSPWGTWLATGWRCALVAAAAVLAARGACGLLAACARRWQRRAVWALLLAPLLTPALAVGYAWSGTSLALAHWPRLNTAIYACVLTARLTAAAVVLLWFAPPSPVTASARWCARLTGPTGGGTGLRLGLWLRDEGPRYGTALALVFLLAAQEFEIAALMKVRAWTTWLFDAQSGGLALGRSLAWATLPMVVQVAVITPVLVLLCRRRRLPAPPRPARRLMRPALRLLAATHLGVAALIACVLPLALVLAQGLRGLPAVLRAFPIARELAASTTVALAAAVIAWAACGALTTPRRGQGIGRGRMAVLVVLCVPGLLGSLLLSLLVHAAFQLPGLAAWRAGPLPLLLTLVLLILPPALLLRGLTLGLADGPAVHLARWLRRAPAAATRQRGRQLAWHLKDRAALYVFFMLFLWAYVDLCAGALLRPVAMTLAPDLLYNQMHYGQRAVLSAMVVAFLAVPPLLMLLARAVRAAAWAR